MRILNLHDWHVKSVRRTTPALTNAKVIGSGMFASVFDDGDPGTVLKLTTDQYSYAYLTDGYAPNKSHAPEVFEDFGCVGETSKGDSLYLVRIERLHPLENGTVLKKFARKLAKQVRHLESFSCDGLEKLEMPLSLRKFLIELEWFFLNIGGAPDLSNANIMRRPDGTLVLSDPVFDQKRVNAGTSKKKVPVVAD